MSRAPDERLVEINEQGVLTLDTKPVTEQQLASELRYMASQYPDLRVAFRGDGTASFQRVAEVLQVIRSTGVKQLGIAARSQYR